MQKESDKKAKDWKNFKWNNAQTARYEEIKHRYLSSDEKRSRIARSPLRSSYQQLPTYKLVKISLLWNHRLIFD